MTQAEMEIISQMVEYMQTVLEKSHPVFGGLPICPFARKARLENKILFQVLQFNANSNLDSDALLAGCLQNFIASTQHEAMLVIHPDPQAMTLAQLQEFLDRLNRAIAPKNLLAFGGHPQEPFNIQGVYTRREPFINFTVQSLAKIKAASDVLQQTAYYQNWSPENLQQVGLPR